MNRRRYRSPSPPRHSRRRSLSPPAHGHHKAPEAAGQPPPPPPFVRRGQRTRSRSPTARRELRELEYEQWKLCNYIRDLEKRLSESPVGPKLLACLVVVGSCGAVAGAPTQAYSVDHARVVTLTPAGHPSAELHDVPDFRG